MADQLKADVKQLYATDDTLKTRKMIRKRELRLSRN